MSIDSISYSLGELHDIDTLSAGETGEGAIRHLKALGLRNFSRIGPRSAPLLAETAGKTLRGSGLDPGEVDAVVYFTSTFDFYRDYDDISVIMADLGLCNALPFGTFLSQCTNFSQALKVARSLMAAEGFRHILILGGDRLDDSRASRVLPSRSSVFSDAVVACMASASGTRIFGLESIHHAFLPEMHRLDSRRDIVQYLDNFSRGYGEVFRETYRRTGMQAKDFRMVVLGNHNLSVLKSIASIGGFPIKRVFLDNVPRHAHCFSADHFIALADLSAGGGLKTGDRILVAASGGYVFSACAFIVR